MNARIENGSNNKQEPISEVVTLEKKYDPNIHKSIKRLLDTINESEDTDDDDDIKGLTLALECMDDASVFILVNTDSQLLRSMYARDKVFIMNLRKDLGVFIDSQDKVIDILTKYRDSFVDKEEYRVFDLIIEFIASDIDVQFDDKDVPLVEFQSIINYKPYDDELQQCLQYVKRSALCYDDNGQIIEDDNGADDDDDTEEEDDDDEEEDDDDTEEEGDETEENDDD